MSAIIHTIGDGTNNVGTDQDPNQSAPDNSRKFDTPFPTYPCNGVQVYCVALGTGIVQVKIWFYDENWGKWFVGANTVGATVNQITQIGEIPRGVKCFAQVIANLGAVKKVGLGFMGDGA